MRRVIEQVPSLKLITGGAIPLNNIHNTFRNSSVKVYTGFFKERNIIDKKERNTIDNKVTPHDESYNNRLIQLLQDSSSQKKYYTLQLKQGDKFHGYDTNFSIDGAYPLKRAGTPNNLNEPIKKNYDVKEIDATISTPITCVTDGETYHIHPSAFNINYKIKSNNKITPPQNVYSPVTP